MDSPTPSQSGARRRLLLADDEPAVAKSMSRVLNALGFDVVTAADGAEALAALKQGEFDVILSDIQMPGLSGVDLLRSVREHDLDVPVVLMTADPRIETAQQAVELGALQYLVKPIEPEVLAKSMERASQLHRMARIKRDALKMLGALENQAGDRAGLSASFDRCLDGLWMAFQPIVAPKQKSIFGFEALLRSKEPALPHPGAVLGAAERLDRLPELGQHIRMLSAKSFADAPQDVLLFVNLHTRDLLDAQLISGASPLCNIASRVVLEITERAAVDDIKDIKTRIATLRSMGFRIAIDDLGAGYAGLTSFALLEPELVKLDMSLVRGVHQSPIKRKLIGSMTSLCKDMGMLVVAEGIETVEERDAVVELGCDYLQGYLFSKPGPPFPTPAWP